MKYRTRTTNRYVGTRRRRPTGLRARALDVLHHPRRHWASIGLAIAAGLVGLVLGIETLKHMSLFVAMEVLFEKSIVALLD